MRHSPHGHFRRQVDFLRQQFLQEGPLPFTQILSSECLSQAIGEIKVPWKDRIFTPLVTLWVFLEQLAVPTVVEEPRGLVVVQSGRAVDPRDLAIPT
jgi:hypothetical protein